MFEKCSSDVINLLQLAPIHDLNSLDSCSKFKSLKKIFSYKKMNDPNLNLPTHFSVWCTTRVKDPARFNDSSPSFASTVSISATSSLLIC